MKISSNIVFFYHDFGLEKTIDIFSEAGFEAIDFNADLEEYYSDVHDKDFYVNVKKYAADRGITFNQTHAPFATSYVEDEKTKIRFEEIVRSMKHSSWLGADMVVVHPGKHINYKEDNNYDLLMEYNFDFYKRLIPYAEEYNVKIAIENIGGSITETSKGLLELFNTLNNNVFTICYDVGHANICGQNPADMIAEIGKHIGCTHIHDNDGVHDTHTLPYYGTIEWESVMSAFAKVGYQGNLNYEAGYFVRNVPSCLKNDSAKYMVKVGKQLVDRYLYFKNN